MEWYDNCDILSFRDLKKGYAEDNHGCRTSYNLQSNNSFNAEGRGVGRMGLVVVINVLVLPKRVYEIQRHHFTIRICRRIAENIFFSYSWHHFVPLRRPIVPCRQEVVQQENIFHFQSIPPHSRRGVLDPELETSIQSCRGNFCLNCHVCL